eukprot:CAMPEP_0195071786 /NCGR_PEP_ID=MMETSP0448-20130528/15502_1 /TAXON_ID=66468 /ORGANISM="Heterocapsa triquestra, Strain CCMP 448" /LENGTH=220 /DNA_ID=CAMNT_0040103685 /DNA_START=195 /DNA_END=854 /DNA_ORIENTATION=+
MWVGEWDGVAVLFRDDGPGEDQHLFIEFDLDAPVALVGFLLEERDLGDVVAVGRLLAVGPEDVLHRPGRHDHVVSIQVQDATSAFLLHAVDVSHSVGQFQPQIQVILRVPYEGDREVVPDARPGSMETLVDLLHAVVLGLLRVRGTVSATASATASASVSAIASATAAAALANAAVDAREEASAEEHYRHAKPDPLVVQASLPARAAEARLAAAPLLLLR